MKLSNRIIITGKYQGRSKFDFFTNLKEGDVIELSIEIEPIRRGSHSGLYATMVKMKNLTSKASFSASLTETTNYLSKMQYTE